MRKVTFILFFIISGLVFCPGCKKSDVSPGNSLTGVEWILESIRYSPQNILSIRRIFTILFNEDLTFRMQVDCNSCSGAYVTGAGNALSFEGQMVCTDAYCGDDSPDDEFHAALRTVSRYEMEGDRLRLYFNDGQSYLDFIAGSGGN